MRKAHIAVIVAGLLAGVLQAEPSEALRQPGLDRPVQVAVCQMAAGDGKVDENLAAAAEQVRQAAAAGANLCVFPELIDVGFGDIVKSAGSDVPLAQPIPGRTSRRLGEIARGHGVWISTAILERVPGGAYDTNVVIDSAGHVVHKQRKAFVYPAFAGTTAFQGNYLDARAVDSPWGPLAVVNCADIGRAGARRIIAEQRPVLVLVSFANPQANLLTHCADLARQCACPVIGANLVFASGAKRGGRSRFVAADGRTLWQADRDEVVKVLRLALPTRRPVRLPVDAGRVQTLRWPRREARLVGRTAKGWPGLKVAWSKVDGPGQVTFSDTRTGATTVAFSQPGIYVLALTATCEGGVGTDCVSVNVLPADGSDPGLIGYWPFDGNGQDASGRRNHAKLQGAAFSTKAAPTGGANGGSLRVTASGYASVPHSDSLNAPSLAAVALWVQVCKPPVMWPDRGKNPVGLVGKGNWWQENYALGLGDYWYLFGRGMGGVQVPALSDVVRTSGRWHHVAAVLDAHRRQGRLYIDGVLHHTAVCGAASSGGVNGEPLCFGRLGPRRLGLDGLLDDVRVYVRALSGEEIARLVPGARVNPPLEVAAGAPITAVADRPIALRGSCTGGNPSPSSRSAAWAVWRKVLGPGQVRFDDVFAPATNVRFTAPGRYLLELRCSDGTEAVWDTVPVQVSATSVRQEAPAARAKRSEETGGLPEGLLFREGFDDPNVARRGWYDVAEVRICKQGARAGKGCIEYDWEGGGKAVGSRGLRHLFKPTEVVYLRFYIRLSKGWGWSGRNYHPHMLHFLTTENPKYHGPASSHLTLYIEANAGRLRLGATDMQNAGTRHGLTQGPLRGGYNGKLYDSRQAVLTDADWHCVEAMFKLNSLDAGNGKWKADGELRGWVDGKLVLCYNSSDG